MGTSIVQLAEIGGRQISAMGSAPSSKHFHECGEQLLKRRLSEQDGGTIRLLKPGSEGGRVGRSL